MQYISKNTPLSAVSPKVVKVNKLRIISCWVYLGLPHYLRRKGRVTQRWVMLKYRPGLARHGPIGSRIQIHPWNCHGAGQTSEIERYWTVSVREVCSCSLVLKSIMLICWFLLIVLLVEKYHEIWLFLWTFQINNDTCSIILGSPTVSNLRLCWSNPNVWWWRYQDWQNYRISMDSWLVVPEHVYFSIYLYVYIYIYICIYR